MERREKYILGRRAAFTKRAWFPPQAIVDQGPASYSSQANSSLLPGFANKVLMAHSHGHTFMYNLWLL